MIDVWKSGGTTIADQTKGKQVSVQELENRSKWMTFVRDPIDHFLSGYSECRFRTHEKRRVNELPAWNPAKYDHQIRVWLKEVKDATRIDKIDCHIHSFPQANFLIDKESKQFYPRIQAIGDMHELPAFLETIAKFPYNYQQGRSRVATENHVKMNYFPSRRDLLTEHTLQQICKFVSLDYYFFAFEPPAVCKTDNSILLTPETQQLLPILEKPERPSSRKEVVGEHDKYIRPFVRRPSPLAKMITLQKQHQDPKRLDHHQHVKLQQFLLQPQGGRRQQQQQEQAVEQLDHQQKLLEERLARVKQVKETLLLQQEQQEQAKR
jgi:Sulfotransferase family